MIENGNKYTIRIFKPQGISLIKIIMKSIVTFNGNRSKINSLSKSY